MWYLEPVVSKARVFGPDFPSVSYLRIFVGREINAASREIVLYRGAVPVTGPDAQGAVHRGDP
jgi:hypothetical protein